MAGWKPFQEYGPKGVHWFFLPESIERFIEGGGGGWGADSYDHKKAWYKLFNTLWFLHTLPNDLAGGWVSFRSPPSRWCRLCSNCSSLPQTLARMRPSSLLIFLLFVWQGIALPVLADVWSSVSWGDTIKGGGFFILIKKKIKFSSYISKLRVEQLQSHIWERAS